ncbi:LOG family protein [Rhodopila globiformis]|uniref:Cytokinin riboside 5'-monophosphate phosphoribohydrolase n=1 Tax=Rhodopila globiformis TaxID=1071 RepID=A0A2S6N4Q4_RHOGL|nr:TIGR00730 family Rossman fold protein [Rhodopila globiformis]PPQ29567.1 Rossman fold protein, TIGR00730 family [Rhodopila globiformis]
MTAIHSLAVFCGSRVGVNPAYAEAGRLLGQGLARAGIRLVFGGGRIGIMGVIADAVLEGGGTALGVIPEFLTQMEVAHSGVTEMVVTDSMHTRKLRLYAESDAFLIMPGGLGTFDEAFEIITWRQLRLHDKPILVCDVEGWARPLAGLIDHAIAQGFAAPTCRTLFEVVDGVPAVLDRLKLLPAGTGEPVDRF